MDRSPRSSTESSYVQYIRCHCSLNNLESKQLFKEKQIRCVRLSCHFFVPEKSFARPLMRGSYNFCFPVWMVSEVFADRSIAATNEILLHQQCK